MSNRLTPQLVLMGYQAGAFPMADPRGRIAWFSPDPRCIFTYESFHVPHALRKTIRRGVFEIRVDTAFDAVIAACANRAGGTWISREIIDAYGALHRMGFAHSVEAWKEGELAGGLYGVAIGGAFFGESMFHFRTDASKAALVALIERLKSRGYRLIDTQWPTPHLLRFGVIEIPRREYLRRLKLALALPCRFE